MFVLFCKNNGKTSFRAVPYDTIHIETPKSNYECSIACSTFHYKKLYKLLTSWMAYGILHLIENKREIGLLIAHCSYRTNFLLEEHHLRSNDIIIIAFIV